MSRYNPQVSVFFTAQPTAVTGPRGIAKKSCTTPLFFSLSLSLYIYVYVSVYVCMYVQPILFGYPYASEIWNAAG